MLATTGDVLRIWELKTGEAESSSRIGYGSNGYDGGPSYSLTERSVLSNVSRILTRTN